MPYVTCPSCSLSAYSAARFSTVDECARCGTPLRGAARTDLPAAFAADRVGAQPRRAPLLRVLPGGRAAA